MKKLILYVSISLMAGLLFTNIYNSLVDAPNWCSNIPESIENTRNYFNVSDPGTFFRIFSPTNQVLGILVLVLFWRAGKRARLYFGCALLFAILVDVMTFVYFFPRNEMLFSLDVSNNLKQAANVCKEWQVMNWVRSSIVLIGLVFQFAGLNTVNKK